MTKKKPRSKVTRYAPLLAGLFITTSVGSAAVYFLKQMMATPPPQTRRVIQEVKLIRPPPPPPEVEQPPPPEVKEDVPLPEPEQAPDTPSDEPPPGEVLSLDAAGVAGGDAFGLGANRGGRSLLGSGGDRYAWYAGQLKEDLISFLSEHRDIRSRAYSVNVRLWLDGQGAVTRVDLAGSTGDKDLDKQLRDLLASIDRVGEAPPNDMPQPVKIRIVSRL
jgi:periplasmic protein TonB